MSLIYDAEKRVLAQTNLLVEKPEENFKTLAEGLGGEHIKLDPGSACVINLLDMFEEKKE